MKNIIIAIKKAIEIKQDDVFDTDLNNKELCRSKKEYVRGMKEVLEIVENMYMKG